MSQERIDPRLAQMERIVASAAFAGAGRQGRFLRYVVEQTIGGGADAIKEYVIGIEVYDKAPAFDPKLDSTVRTEASKLRGRLATYYETEGQSDPVLISIPKGAYVPAFETRKAAEPAEPPSEPVRSPRPFPYRYFYLAGGLALTLAVAALVLRKAPTPPQLTPVRLTNDLGYFTSPAISGELAAYASDRSGRGDLDIWIQPIRGGDPLRLTDHPADDRDPDISPDGSTVAFRSERDGGGVWLVPSLGGQARLFARGGKRPRFSPDGLRIAYHNGDERLFSSTIVSGKAFTGPVAGGEHTMVAPGLNVAVEPVWAPDGKRLLVRGYAGADFATVKMDWFVASADGGQSPVPTGARDRIGESANCNLTSIAPGAWTATGVVFSMVCGNGRDLWRLPISPDGKAGRLERLTTGSAAAHSPMARGNTIAYGASNSNTEIWAVPIRAGEGIATGPPVRVTNSIAAEQHPSISRDGRTMAFTTMRAGSEDIWLADLVTGRERPFATGPTAQNYAILNPEGTEVTWTELIPDPKDPVGFNHIVRRAPIGGGPPTKICEHCAFMGVGPDGRRLLDLDGRPVHLALLDPVTQTWTPYLRHASADVIQGTPSPDRSWIAFVNRGHIYATRYSIPAAQPGDWVDLGAGTMPVWAPGGGRIYYVSDRDGHRCVWTAKFDGVAGRPGGEASAVAHFHAAAKRVTPGVAVFRWMAVAEDKVVLPVTEIAGSIWLLR